MKRLNLLIVIALIFISFSACDGNRIIVENTTTGAINSIVEPYNVTKVGDTVVVMSSARNVLFYGKYKGQLPASTATGGVRYVYTTAVRIK